MLRIATTTRRTKTRRRVEQLLQTTSEPVSLQQLYRSIKKILPATAYSTIFRIIRRLEEEQHVRRVDWRERGSRYEWAERPHHHHLTCQNCKKVVDLDDGVLNYRDKKIEKKTGFITKHHSIELEGICPDCQHFAAR